MKKSALLISSLIFASIYSECEQFSLDKESLKEDFVLLESSSCSSEPNLLIAELPNAKYSTEECICGFQSKLEQKQEKCLWENLPRSLDAQPLLGGKCVDLFDGQIIQSLSVSELQSRINGSSFVIWIYSSQCNPEFQKLVAAVQNQECTEDISHVGHMNLIVSKGDCLQCKEENGNHYITVCLMVPDGEEKNPSCFKFGSYEEFMSLFDLSTITKERLNNIKAKSVLIKDCVACS